MKRSEITAPFVARLVAAQFPEWRDLPVAPVRLAGWDNVTFRLGDDKSVRIPSAEPYEAQVAKEHEWLPVLAPQLPFPIPQPLALGRPAMGLPRRWSVYRWIDGEPATADRVCDLEAFARDLGGFLAALYRIDPENGPAAGAHSFSRGLPVRVWDDETRAAIGALHDVIDARAALQVWDAAVAADDDGVPNVWVHGDITGSNLLVRDGQLAAVLDFGCSAVGDPACDLMVAWTNLTGAARQTFRQLLPLDDATWMRARGWALWRAVMTLHLAREAGVDPAARCARFGWRLTPGQIIEEIQRDADIG